MEVWSQVLGRFHPLVVHLPIGILCLAAIAEWLSVKPTWHQLRTSIPLMWGLGALSAVIACLSGYTLGNYGTYEQEALTWHRWTAICFAAYSILLFLLRKKGDFRYGRIVALFTILGMSITGHLGGSLTHGEDFLLAPFAKETGDTDLQRQAIANLQQAMVYEDIIVPILRSKCTSCHGRSKQKGKLALHTPQSIRRGGKSGSDVLAADPMNIGRPANNTILHRINLPPQEEEHMPPKDKAQLSPAEKQLLEWWINNKAPFDKKVMDLNPTDTLLAQLQYWNENIDLEDTNPLVRNIGADLPDVKLPNLNPSILEEVRQHGILILPAGKDSPFLEVNFVNVATFSDSLFASLTPLIKHIVRLKLSDQAITDQQLLLVGQMENLMRLYLDHTLISDEGLKNLSALKNLQLLNLVGTQVSEKGLAHIQDLPNLKRVYGFLTNVKPIDVQNQGLIDTGGYLVPTLSTDTILIPQN